MTVNPEFVQQALDDLESEVRILRIIVLALFEHSDNKAEIISRLEGVIAESTKPENVPHGTPSEVVVNLRARAAVYLAELRIDAT